MTPLSITFHHDSNSFGGMELYLFRLIDHLDPDRFACSLLVPGSRSEWRASPERVVEEATLRGLAVLRPGDPGTTSPAPAKELVATARLLRSHRTDLVHIHTCRPIGARRVTVAARLAGVRAVVRTEHFPPSATADPSDWIRLRPFDWLTDRIVTCSDGDRAEQLRVLRRSPRKVVQVRNGIPVDGLDPEHDSRAAKAAIGLDPDVPVISNVGRLVAQKGQRYLLEAFARVIAGGDRAELLIIGDGPLHDELESLSSELGIADHVHLVGYQEEPLPYLRATDVAAMPSLFEGLSLALLEYMALGKPVVASDHPSFTEALRSGRDGVIVPRGQVQPLADALVRLLRDPSVRRRMGDEAAARVRSDHDVVRVAEEMMDLYDEVSARRRRG